MKIQYEPGDLVQRFDHYESSALKVVEVKEDGLMVFPTHPNEEYPEEPFFIAKKDVLPLANWVRLKAHWVVQEPINTPGPK